MEGRGGQDLGLRVLVDELMELLEAEAAREKSPVDEAFQRQMQQFRREISAVSDGDAVGRVGAACIESCRQYFGTRRVAASERESGFRGMIQVMSDGLSTLVQSQGRAFEFARNGVAWSHECSLVCS